MRLLVALISLATLLVPVQASTLEDVTNGFVSYQYDGDSHHDAPDQCGEASTDWRVPLGSSTDGILLAPDDASDFFFVDVPSDLRGQRLHVELAEATDLESLELTTFLPGCAGTVHDVANWPTPPPSPPAPAEGERQVALEQVAEPWHCRSDGRLFWVEVMPGYEAPAAIHVAWTDGSEAAVPLSDNHGNAHALYGTSQALGTTLKGAWVNMPADWSGRFVYVAGPCDAADGGAVYGEPPVAGTGSLAFTPVVAGWHVVQVTYRQAPDLASTAQAEPPSSDGVLGMPNPLVGTRSCHTCVNEVEDVADKVSYVLTAVLGSAST